MDATARTARKLKFFDALTASAGVSDLDCRIAWRILRLLHNGEGPAWPSYETLAGEACCSRRSAIRAVANLVNEGWFIKHSSKGGIWYGKDGELRGKPNHLMPNWSRVPPESPLTHSTVTPVSPLNNGSGAARVTTTTAKGDNGGSKGDISGSKSDTGVTQYLLSNPLIESNDANPLTPRSGERAPDGAYSFDEMFQSVYSAGQRPKPPQEAVVWSLDDDAEEADTPQGAGQADGVPVERTDHPFDDDPAFDKHVGRLIANTVGWVWFGSVVGDRVTGPKWRALRVLLTQRAEQTGGQLAKVDVLAAIREVDGTVHGMAAE